MGLRVSAEIVMLLISQNAREATWGVKISQELAILRSRFLFKIGLQFENREAVEQKVTVDQLQPVMNGTWEELG